MIGDRLGPFGPDPAGWPCQPQGLWLESCRTSIQGASVPWPARRSDRTLHGTLER